MPLQLPGKEKTQGLKPYRHFVNYELLKVVPWSFYIFHWGNQMVTSGEALFYDIPTYIEIVYS